MRFPFENRCFIPVGDHPGAFGYQRKYDRHTGIDLYCQSGEPVYAMESGTVLQISGFTGPSVGYDWWLDTKAMLIQGSNFINYGEIEPNPELGLGSFVQEGDLIAHVVPVLPDDKLRPDIPHHSTSMLHLELYSEMPEKWVEWIDERPKGLLNPIKLLD